MLICTWEYINVHIFIMEAFQKFFKIRFSVPAVQIMFAAV